MRAWCTSGISFYKQTSLFINTDIQLTILSLKIFIKPLLLCDVKVCVPSDWLPTFLSLANSSHLVEGLGLDGVDQTRAFRTGEQVGFEV